MWYIITLLPVFSSRWFTFKPFDYRTFFKILTGSGSRSINGVHRANQHQLQHHQPPPNCHQRGLPKNASTHGRTDKKRTETRRQITET
nr:MAG TPA_asm: hypothetical protein [Caudoviricetes sp.]